MALIPSLLSIIPFAALLLCVAILPLFKSTEHWWHRNRNKLLIASSLAAVTLIYYVLRGYGLSKNSHATAAGFSTVAGVLHHAMLDEYVPFMSLLFSLYVIAGGIHLKGELPARPLTNTLFLAVGGLLANLVGTTGASVLLIRPLLRTNRHRTRVAHTVIFFIFIVSNIGGTLLPIGDPPLFLGYLAGVPFLWTLQLWRPWALCMVVLLFVYYLWDRIEHRREPPERIQLDETLIEPLSLDGGLNILWLLAVVVVTGAINPGQPLVGTDWLPPPHLREGLQLLLVGVSLVTTPRRIHRENGFEYAPILEVACLFIGIFICMQPALEILDARGSQLGLSTPAQFFWWTGGLSAALDNAPTYMVFFEAAKAISHASDPEVFQLNTGHFIRADLLGAISVGAVFMGALTYIGNGPNFMVKSIADRSGVRMPSFFKYLLYSTVVLVPLFIVITFIFPR